MRKLIAFLLAVELLGFSLMVAEACFMYCGSTTFHFLGYVGAALSVGGAMLSQKLGLTFDIRKWRR